MRKNTKSSSLPRVVRGYLEEFPLVSHARSGLPTWYAPCERGKSHYITKRPSPCSSCDLGGLTMCNVNCGTHRYRRVHDGDYLVSTKDGIFRVVRDPLNYGTLRVEKCEPYNPDAPLIMMREGMYHYRDCFIKCHGYYPPDRCVAWEATSDLDGSGVCRGRSLKEVMRIVDDEIEKGRWLAEHPQNERDI